MLALGLSVPLAIGHNGVGLLLGIRPELLLLFFGLLSLIVFAVALILFIPVFIEYGRTGLVRRLPTLVTAGFMGMAALLLLVCGLILTIRKPAGEAKPFLNGKEEVKRFISIILVIAAYIVLMWLFGFLVPTLLVVCLLCFMFAEGKNIPKWQPIVYSIIVTGALSVAFVYMLKLRLPVGTLLDISL